MARDTAPPVVVDVGGDGADNGGAGAGAPTPSTLPTKTPALAPKATLVRGGVKSCRPWKKKPSARTSSMYKRGGPSAFKVQQVARKAQQAAKALERQRREDRAAARLAEKEARELKAKRKAENELKSASYQVLRDPEKMKRMSKKQLRMVKRTRTNAQGVTELVGAYEK